MEALIKSNRGFYQCILPYGTSAFNNPAFYSTIESMNTAVPPVWENPEIQGINRLPMRSPLLPFAGAESALFHAIAGPEFSGLGGCPFFFSLDGKWRFRLIDNPHDDTGREADAGRAVPAWTLPEFNDEAWDTITVPGTWSLQKSRDGKRFDKPHYTNVQMPFQAVPPKAPKENPAGLYRTGFTLPDGWAGRRVALHIGSAESCCLVYVNGIFAGAGKDTRLPSEYDITALLLPGENILCLKVIRYSDASYVEDQDQWWFGGLHRSVFLYSTTDCYIQDAQAIPGGPVDGENSAAAHLRLTVTLGGKLPEGSSAGNQAVSAVPGDPFIIQYGLYPFTLPKDRDDALRITKSAKAVVEGEISLDCGYRLNANRAEAGIVVQNPKVWSHEAPHLYVMLVSVSRGGMHLESCAFCTGFRTVRVKNRELLVNGKPVLIKGVNRHEHDEKTGKTLSTGSMVRDIMLLKQHNFNAVRTSHYPNDERWYDLCDRYGIYLVDEANIENHCFYSQLSADSAWTYAYTSRVQRMVERDKNHPSIIIWSLGNESGEGPAFSMCSAWVRHADPSRPVNYEGAIRPEGGQGTPTLDSLCRGRNITDIVSPMYPPIDLITGFAKYRDDPRPLIMIEYSHAMGNSNGGLAGYWKAVESHRGLQGGFIWDWIDQGIEALSETGEKYWKYGGDFGDEPTDYDFCLNGLLFPDQTPKPAMAECKQLFAPVKLKPLSASPFGFTLENNFDFSGLSGLELYWELRGEDSVIEKGIENLPSVESGCSAEIVIPVSPNVDLLKYAGIVYIHAEFRLNSDTPWARAGFCVAQAERIIREKLPLSASAFAAVSASAPATVEKSESISALRDFARLFKPSLFRAPTENDGLKTYSHLRGDPAALFYYENKALYPWLDLDLLHLRCVDEQTETAGEHSVRYTATLLAGSGAAKGFENKRLGVFTTVITGAAPHIVMDIAFDLDPSLPELAKAGVSAAIPALYNRVEWFGLGPEESYPDRMAGVFLGNYSRTPEQLETPYVVPQENGNRGGLRKLVIMRNKDAQCAFPPSVTILPDRPLNFSVSRYTPENMLAARHTCDLADISKGENGHYILNIDCAQRGVGTAACGPDTLEQYRVRPGSFGFRLLFSAG